MQTAPVLRLFCLLESSLSGIDRRGADCFIPIFSAMKVATSLKSLKHRHPDCQVVRRKGRVYVINKTNPRFKARQG